MNIKPASLGSVSHGTLRTEDLLSSFASELESRILANGDFFSLPENRNLRDRLNKLVGEAQDAWSDDGETLQDEEQAADLVNEIQDVLSIYFAPAYAVFGAHEGDGSDFGYWPLLDEARESCEFVSSESAENPDDDFRGEWLHINERGNCTLYIREDSERSADGYSDREVWGVA